MTYTTLRLQLEPRSGLVTPLQADTIWGHLASYLSMHDKSLFKTFLQSYRETNPAVVFSDGLPAHQDAHGTLMQYYPRPVMPTTDAIANGYIQEGGVMNNTDMFQLKKLLKKTIWISSADLIRLSSGQNFSQLNFLINIINKAPSPIKMQSATSIKNIVPRLGGDTTPFSVNEIFLTTEQPESSTIWTILVKVRPDLVTELEYPLKQFLQVGYGKKKSTGKGQFAVSLEPHPELPQISNPNSFLSLSSWVPGQTDPRDGWWQSFVKYGKVGETAEQMAGFTGSPFKTPVIMMKPGSVFRIPDNQQVQDWYGFPNLPGIREEEDYVHPTLAFSIPFRVE